MAMYIDAEKLEKDGWSASRTYQQDAKTMVYETKKMTDFPTADVVERKKGEWIEVGGVFRCSKCEKCYPYATDYCPNCGARMKGEDDDRSMPV